MTPFLGSMGENLSGAWAVMRGRPDGLERLDLSVEGFWRSFGAILLILPFAVLTVLSQRMLPPAPGETPTELTGDDMALQGVGLVADWLAFPLIFAALAGSLGLGSRYVPFIVARNWAAVVISASIAVLHAAHLLGILPGAILPFLLLLALGISLRFSYLIARIALHAPISMALPIVVCDFLLSVTIWAAIDRAI